MSLAETPERPIPPAIIVGGALVMAVSLLAVGSARMGVAPRQARPLDAPVASYDFRVAPPDATGVQAMLSARDGARIGPLSRKGDDFLPSLLETLGRERAQKGVSGARPFRLVRFADGRVSLEDPATGRELNLESFGSVNEADAARLIDEGRASDGRAGGGAGA